MLDFRTGTPAHLVRSHIALNKRDGSLGIHQTQADFPVGVFQLCQAFNVLFQLPVFLFKHAIADFFQVPVHVFQSIRQVFHFLVENTQQDIQGLRYLDPAASHSQAQQAEIRQSGITEREQPPFLHHKGHRGSPGPTFRLEQEQGVNVEPLLITEKAGRSFNFFHVVGIGQFRLKKLLDQVPLVFLGINQVDPAAVFCQRRHDGVHILFAQNTIFDSKDMQHDVSLIILAGSCRQSL